MNIEEDTAFFKRFTKRTMEYETMRESLHNAPSPEIRLQRFRERSQTTFDFYVKNDCWYQSELWCVVLFWADL